MKKTVKISLGGTAFNVEEDAFAFLEQYLESIRKHLGDTPEAAEIINDIEERAAELLSGMLEKVEIITLSMVQSVADTLGKPEEIADSASDGSETYQDPSEPAGTKRRKRFYRDPNGSVIGGVCTGLGAYFDANPVVFRVFFVLLAFANGIGLIVYAAMWVLLPRAETARQRLEMKGEPVNLENLEKTIKEEYEHVRSNLKRKNIDSSMEHIGDFIKRALIAVGTVVTVIAKVIITILGIVFIVAGLFSIAVIIGAFFLQDLALGMILPELYGANVTDFVATTLDCAPVIWAIVPIFLVIVIPFILLVYLGIKMVFRFRVRSAVPVSILASIWVLSVAMLAFLVFFQARSFTIRETVMDHHLLERNEGVTTLYLTADGFDDPIFALQRDVLSIDPYTVATADGKIRILGRPQVHFIPSPTDTFDVRIEKVSRGATRILARLNAGNIIMPLGSKDSTLSLYPFFILPDGDRWRVQEVRLTVAIPEGKRISIDKSLEAIIDSEQEYTNAWPDELAGRTWRMEQGRLVRD